MKKIFKILIISILMFIFKLDVNAYSIDFSSNKNVVYVGETVQFNLKTNDVWGTYYIKSSNTSILNGSIEDDIGQTSFLKNDIYFQANSLGKVIVTFGPISNCYLTDSDDTCINETRSVTINVVAKATNSNTTIDVNKNYSKNNYLKSLEIEGYTLTPNFNKDTLEYSVELEPGTEVININATKEDKKACIKGNGEVNVTEGINTLNVVVTAENGNERTYVIKASVEEKDPINVKVNGNKYRVIKKAELLPTMDGYTPTTVNINEFDIPALYNEVTKITLVGLKDENGNISLFSYDSKNGEYKEYSEFSFDKMNLYIHKDLKSKYEETKIKINDKEVTAYKLNGIDDYYLLYATNTITGNVGYYLYDIKENSVQRYDTTMLDGLNHQKNKYLSIVLVLSSVCFLSMLFLLIEVNRDNKIKNEEL